MALAFPAGALAKGDAHSAAVFVADAPRDGAPLHVGLGKAERFDLRVILPGESPLVLRDVTAQSQLTATPAGISTANE